MQKTIISALTLLSACSVYAADEASSKIQRACMYKAYEVMDAVNGKIKGHEAAPHVQISMIDGLKDVCASSYMSAKRGHRRDLLIGAVNQKTISGLSQEELANMADFGISLYEEHQKKVQQVIEARNKVKDKKGESKK